MLEFFSRFDITKYGSEGGPLHDPSGSAWLLKPELFEGKHVNVAIETGSPLTTGHDGGGLLGCYRPRKERQLSALRRR